MNLLCPVCGTELLKHEKRLVCSNNHSFDIASEGYVNLLLKGKNGSLIGDNRAMALARRDFLNKGYYCSLAQALKNELDLLNIEHPTAADICCGEGYYTDYISKDRDGDFFGFDISKEMIRLAAKRKSKAQFAVANMKSLPLKDDSIDFATHLFAPFCEEEFARILSDRGILISVIPGRYHLFELKAAVYDTPYENAESLPDYKTLSLMDQKRIKTHVTLQSNDDILTLFSMTPYYYRTSPQNRQKLADISKLDVTLDFVMNIFKKYK